ncbi:MAG: tetratricopeptide repeat protein [Desulfobacteraceae bacterium]|nr:tetratricopeptide repeat protein [Desulfobacteraceae bacterium]
MCPAEKHRTLSEWFEYGRRCFHKPDGMEAVRALEKVVEMDPGYRHPDGDNPYFYLGKIHEMEGRLEQAIVLYSRALAVNPQDEESRIGRGSCYTVTRQHERAIEDFTHLLRLPEGKRKVPRKHLLQAIAENHRQLEDWGQAVYWAQKAMEADPADERLKELYERIFSAGRSH